MRKVVLSLRTALIPLALILGLLLTLHPAKTPLGLITVDLAGGNPRYTHWWQHEVARRFPNALMIVGHGGVVVEGEWLLVDSAHHQIRHIEEVVAHYQRLYPGRPVVLVCCNPDHLHLHVHGVWYAMENVNMVPDRALPLAVAQDGPPPLDYCDHEVGNIYEFIEGD